MPSVTSGSNYTQDRSFDIILPLVSLLLCLLFFGWIIYVIITAPRDRTSASGQEDGDVFLQCATGQCATNIYSGEKICPSSDRGTIYANPRYEVCNEPTICNNPLTPYAVQPDGSTDVSGVCAISADGNPTTCPCLSQPQCASYITTLFQISSGNPYASSDQPLTLTQVGSSTTPEGVVVDNPPLSYNNASTLCSIPLSWLPLATPGCHFTPTMDAEAITTCMGFPNACNGVLDDPCLKGTLAFLASDSEAFSSSDINKTPLACVRGTSCACGSVAVWDNSLGGIVCKVIV